jgi:pentatricopeptide repeat protein
MALTGDFNGQRELLTQADAERVQVDQHFFTSIMDAQGQQPEWVHAEMRARGFAQNNTYEAKLRMLIDKNLEHALRVYREMRSQQIFPSEVCSASSTPALYVYLIHYYRELPHV